MIAAGVVLASGLAATSSSFAAEAPSTGCADVEIIGARGTTEAPGVGRILQPVAAEMTAELDAAVRTTPLDYPASVNYTNSVRQGVDAVRVELAAIAESCPDTAIVLMGYSQGADVMGDVLAAMPTAGSGSAMTRGGMMGMGMSRGEMMSRMRERMAARAAAARANGGGMMGGGMMGGGMMSRMRQRLANMGGGGMGNGGMGGGGMGGGRMDMAMEPGMMQVEAVVLFGDPTFTGGEPFNAGTGQADGIFSRGAGNLGAFADRTVSFCNGNDPICQRGAGGGSGGGHGDYVKFSGAATEFVAGRVQAG